MSGGEDKHGEKKQGRLSSHKTQNVAKPQYSQWDGRQRGKREWQWQGSQATVILSHFCTTRRGGFNDISSKSDLLWHPCLKIICLNLCNRGTNILGLTQEFFYMHRCQLSACVLATPEAGLALEHDQPFSPHLQMLSPCMGRAECSCRELHKWGPVQNPGCWSSVLIDVPKFALLIFSEIDLNSFHSHLQFKTTTLKNETVAAGCSFCCHLPSSLAFHSHISCQHKCHDLDSKMLFKPLITWPTFWLWKWGQVDSIFKSLLKSTAKIADNITRALGLKGFHGASVSDRSAGFISLFYISFTHRILGISTVLCPAASPFNIPEAVPLSMFVCNI